MQKTVRILVTALVLTVGLGIVIAPLGGARHGESVHTASSAPAADSSNDLSWGD